MSNPTRKFKNKSRFTPYLFLTPTVVLMLLLLVLPIILVIYYSFLNNAIVVKNPVFVGLRNYREMFADDEFWGAVKNTAFFVGVSVIGHMIIGMGFALLLNSDYIKSVPKTVARVIYILPWVFTASVIAILWKLMLQPSGIINFLLSHVGMATKDTEWLSNRSSAVMAAIGIRGAASFLNVISIYAKSVCVVVVPFRQRC